MYYMLDLFILLLLYILFPSKYICINIKNNKASISLRINLKILLPEAFTQQQIWEPIAGQGF